VPLPLPLPPEAVAAARFPFPLQPASSATLAHKMINDLCMSFVLARQVPASVEI
jgi:hypothetical protein